MDNELHKLRIDKKHKSRREPAAKWPWAVAILLLAGGAFGAWQYHKSSAVIVVETMRVKPVEAGTQPGEDLVVLNATGYIIAAHKIEVASRVPGRVSWIGVEMGDKVAKDQVLVRLEDDEYKARVMQQQGLLDNAKARLAELIAGSRPEELAQAQAQLDKALVEAGNAKRAYDRVMTVGASRAPAEIDDARSLMESKAADAEAVRQQLKLLQAGTRKEQVAAQAATVEQLKGSLDNATIDLTNTVIRAPIAGTILERNVEVGEFVTNGFVGDRGAKGYVVSMADLDDLLVELDISQNNFASVVPHGPCWIVTDAYPDRKYAGRVERISPIANRQKATVLVRVQVLHPDDHLRPDMNATVSFLAPVGKNETAASQERPVIRIPASAVHDGAVYVVEDAKARRLPVTTGLTAANGDVAINKGLIGGEDLIVQPPDNLKDGDAVRMH